jgi:adenine deaminase
MQYGEVKNKGSIEVGKLADFVILSDNPITMDRSKIADVKVLQTIKEGKVVYEWKDTQAKSSSCMDSDACLRKLAQMSDNSSMFNPLLASPHIHTGNQ